MPRVAPLALGNDDERIILRIDKCLSLIHIYIVHVQTQLPYVLTVAVVSFVCFVIAGFVQNWVICLVIGIVLVGAALLVWRKTVGKRVTQ